MSLISRLFMRRRRFNDISVSIEEHIAERADELVDQGMPRAQALQAAKREFGNVALIKERSREAWQWTAVENFLTDFKLTARRLFKSPGFTITVLLTLAIGIGANTAVFTVIDSILLKPLPYPEADQLVAVWMKAPGAAGLLDFVEGLRLSPSMYLTYAEHNRVFQSIGVWVSGTANVTGIAQPEEVHTTYISDGVLETLNVPAAAGRWLAASDQIPHSHQTVMLSYGYWQRRFGGDPSVIGRNIEVDSQTREIVGVMPHGFEVVNQKFDLLIPLAFDTHKQVLAGFGFNGIARLRPGVTIADADADIVRMLQIWMGSWSNGPGDDPHFYEKVWKVAPAIRPLKQEVIGNIGSVLWLVMATIGVVMLVACTNIANLLLVRAEGRHQELAIRTALGAGRARIAREVLTECVLLALIGGVAGVAVADASLRLLTAIGPANLPRLSEISLDARSIAFTLGIALFSALLFGSIAAFKSMQPAKSLAQASAGRTASTSRERQRGRNLLVVAQVAMAMVLLVSAVLMIRTLAALRNVDPGFTDPNHLETLRISIPQQLVPDAQETARLENSIAGKLAAIPGVSSVGFARSVPMDGIDPAWNNIFIEGTDFKSGAPMRLFNFVSPGYFRSAGTRLVAGRDYTWDDIYGLRPVGIISEGLARESWGSAEAAIGKHFRSMPNQPWFEVIGVAQDVYQNGVDEAVPATVYWPFMLKVPYENNAIDTQRSVTFTVRSPQAGSAALMSEIQRAVWQVNGNLPVASIEILGEIYNRSMARTSFTLVMLAIAGSMAMALSLIGIYGVISYAVTQRTREIGIRIALGAQKGLMRWMFVRSALVMTAIGAVIGLGGAAMLARAMKSLLFGVSPLDPVTFAAVPVILAVAAALASFIPAHRAASIDPMEALRTE